LGEAVAAAQALESHGYREIVLTGILLGSYGRDLPGAPTLATLLAELLAHTTRLRIRISSIEPQDLNPAWFELWQDARLCRHLHIPLQSGCDEILRSMRRQYDVRSYEALIGLARGSIADLAVTTDLLVGFPGEDDADFEQTLAMLERIEFAGMHVFPYSSRPGTLAARMPNHVSDSAKAARGAKARTLSAQSKARFHQRFVGTTQEVLWEKQEAGVWHGLTSNYLSVYIRTDADLHNTLESRRLARADADRLWADLCP
jgi:threonylcarbamoyladenosine tRNA methylthiotransferase MtaB